MNKKHITSIVSRLFGKFADIRFPSFIQCLINRLYVKWMKVDMTRFRSPCKYPTLNALFTRSLEMDFSYELDFNVMVSGVDAYITEVGTIRKGKALQIKGMEYSVRELLGEKYTHALESLEGGAYINFYLSPKDYHRIHSPTELRIWSATHIPGKLYPVNLRFLKKKLDLFIENERVVLECYDRWDRRHFLVLVGALNVGKIVIFRDRRIQTNASSDKITYFRYEDNELMSFHKCHPLGMFQMGSTVVHLAQRGALTTTVQPQTRVQLGKAIAVLNPEG